MKPNSHCEKTLRPNVLSHKGKTFSPTPFSYGTWLHKWSPLYHPCLEGSSNAGIPLPRCYEAKGLESLLGLLRDWNISHQQIIKFTFPSPTGRIMFPSIFPIFCSHQQKHFTSIEIDRFYNEFK
ncbi:hypothetical protein AVEN_84984-1 [Araneus ventricosus]|uniref:Uncharacterized protein n=1 Tax=Araneus ventricosus TaxID=182803 RepID=A0A4Y2BZH3_ARAVE|nr:hypothetical protein AVEN_84984-1 [Araneus ventricosus]